MTSKTLCAIPWNHLAIQQNGDYRACCQCIHPPTFGKLVDENGRQMNVKTDSFSSARNSHVLKDMRASMMRGEKPAVCDLCWHDELTGFDSRRMHTNTMYGEPDVSKTAEDGTIDVETYPIKYMDIRFGNLCNQACRSCGPSDSSLWIEEAAKELDGFPFYGEKIYKFAPKGKTWVIDSDDFQWYERPEFMDEFKEIAGGIDRIYFTGGEPTINKAHFRLLDFLADRNFSKRITLEYNSNVMAIPEKLIKTWEKFALVIIGASVDAYGDLANYVRWPSKWEDISASLIRLDEANDVNMLLGTSSTISILNVLSFLDLVRWVRGNKFKRLNQLPAYHMLHGPDELCVKILPDSTKNYIKKKYEEFFVEMNDDKLNEYMTPILDFMFDGKPDVVKLARFYKRMEQMDAHRNQNTFEILPWLNNDSAI